jgi:hypothetical protein
MCWYIDQTLGDPDSAVKVETEFLAITVDVTIS